MTCWGIRRILSSNRFVLGQPHAVSPRRLDRSSACDALQQIHKEKLIKLDLESDLAHIYIYIFQMGKALQGVAHALLASVA